MQLDVQFVGKSRYSKQTESILTPGLPYSYHEKVENLVDAYRFVKISYIQPPPVQNDAEFRVLSIRILNGLYPSSKISSYTSDALNNRCIIDGYAPNECIQNAFLKNKQEKELLWVNGGSKMQQVHQGDRIYGKCKVPHFDGPEKACLIPMPGNGYITSINNPYDLRIFNNLAKRAEYDGLEDPEKNNYAVITSNTGTNYLVECPKSCKKI